MGFYSPATIINDARRHGVEVRPVDLAHSEWNSTLEGPLEAPHLHAPAALDSEPPRSEAPAGSPRRRSKSRVGETPPGGADGTVEAATSPGRVSIRGRADGLSLRSESPQRSEDSFAEERQTPAPALRIGLRLVHGLGPKARERLQAAREDGPFQSVEDVLRRSGLGPPDLRVLAEAGAFETMWPGRRQALWELLRQARGSDAFVTNAPAPPT